MKRVWLIAVLLIVNSFLIADQQSPKPANSQTSQELKTITQELLQAVAPGDKAVWDKYLAATCLYTDENGRTLTKAQLLEELNPLPTCSIQRGSSNPIRLLPRIIKGG